MADRISERRQEADAAKGNLRVHIAALTRHVLRQGSSLMTMAEAKSQAMDLYRRGLRANDVMGMGF